MIKLIRVLVTVFFWGGASEIFAEQNNGYHFQFQTLYINQKELTSSGSVVSRESGIGRPIELVFKNGAEKDSILCAENRLSHIVEYRSEQPLVFYVAKQLGNGNKYLRSEGESPSDDRFERFAAPKSPARKGRYLFLILQKPDESTEVKVLNCSPDDFPQGAITVLNLSPDMLDIATNTGERKKLEKGSRIRFSNIAKDGVFYMQSRYFNKRLKRPKHAFERTLRVGKTEQFVVIIYRANFLNNTKFQNLVMDLSKQPRRLTLKEMREQDELLISEENFDSAEGTDDS